MPAPDDAWWIGRCDTLRGAVLLQAGRFEEASIALHAAASELARETNPDLAIAVEQALLAALAAYRMGDGMAAAAMRDARDRLAHLAFPPEYLRELAAQMPP